jgi:hypothetical protein
MSGFTLATYRVGRVGRPSASEVAWEFQLDLKPPGNTNFTIDLKVAGEDVVSSPGANATTCGTYEPRRRGSFSGTRRPPSSLRARDCEDFHRSRANRPFLADFSAISG